VAGAGLFGATSAWRAGRLVPVEALKAESGTSTGGPNAARARRAMVIVQVGASVVLLMLASLLTQSLRWQRTATPGFDAAGIGLLSLDLLRQRVPVDQWPALTQRAVDLARTTPGVRDADIGLRSPLTPGEDVILVRIPGYDPRHEQNGLDIDFNVVGPEYFSTLGVPFERGGPWDGRSPASTAVINHTMAERYWPGVDPVGRTVLIDRAPATVTGVVADSVYYDIAEAPRPYIYLPAHIQPPGSFVLHLRGASDGDPRAVAGLVARRLADADTRLASFDVMSFDDLRQVPLFPARMLTMAAVVFGVVSLVLTAVGLYGVIAASVGARTREIGLRLALGASQDRVRRGVISEALVLSMLGGSLGLFAGYLSAQQLRGWLFGVGVFDPGITAATVAGIVVLAVMSAWIPARRAARVDPERTLR
jgi:predicted permease